MDSYQIVFALIPITLLGSVLNWSIFYSIHKLQSLNNSFGYLSANQAFSDALHSTTFLLYFCPMVLLDHPFLKAYSHHCGFVILFCYELSVFTHFAISINRFFAVWMPLKYESMFNIKRTRWMIVFMWIFIGSIAVLFYQKFCYLYYDEATHFFTFTNTEFCGMIGWYGDFLKNAVIVAVVVSLDILTVIKIQARVNQENQNKLSQRDIRFLKQAVFQASVFMLELLTYFFFPLYFQNRWVVFFGTSFAWVAVHAADGMVVIVCNPEVRKFLMNKKTNSMNSTASRTTNLNDV